jgi:hypothetical protein
MGHTNKILEKGMLGVFREEGKTRVKPNCLLVFESQNK